MGGADRTTGMAGSATARYPAAMSEPRFNLEQAAANALNRYGVGAIWELHLVAAKAYRKGNKPAAGLLMEVADEAEREWLRRAKDNRSG